MKIWFCKIGEVAEDGWFHKGGQDGPMRNVVQRMYKEVTGRDAEFCFSGWAGELDEGERACVETRMPDITKTPLEPKDAKVLRQAARGELCDRDRLNLAVHKLDRIIERGDVV